MARIEADAGGLRQLIAESAEFAALLRAPLVAKSDKVAVFAALAKKAEFSDLTARFLQVLARRGRTALLPGILDAFDVEMAERQGQVTARVESAIALTEKQKKDLTAVLAATKKGKIAIDNVVDPAVLGGLIVTVGSTRMDDSLRGKLARLGAQMRGGMAA